MPLINCKIEFSLGWYEECILSNDGDAATFTITDAKLYVPVVTLRTEDNTKLSKSLNEGFKRSIHWNKYKVIFKDYNNEYIRERIDASFQGVNKLFFFLMQVVIILLMKNHIEDTFFQEKKPKNYNIEIDERNFYDHPINDSIKLYDEVRKISTGNGDDYTTGCLLDFAYFKKIIK